MKPANEGDRTSSPPRSTPLTADYDRWIVSGLEAHPQLEKPAGKRGRATQSKERNLLLRMSEKRAEVLRFAHDLSVPFDNNQAERDLRMIKVQQKVSGSFRSERGAGVLCSIQSYLSTARKHSPSLMDSIRTASAVSRLEFSPEELPRYNLFDGIQMLDHRSASTATSDRRYFNHGEQRMNTLRGLRANSGGRSNHNCSPALIPISRWWLAFLT